MTNLTKALKRSGLDDEDKKAIREAVRAYQKEEGMSREDAVRQALADMTEEAIGERQRISKHASRYKLELPAAPERAQAPSKRDDKQVIREAIKKTLAERQRLEARARKQGLKVPKAPSV